MLRVNSFPRTGNIFASSFLNRFFDKSMVDGEPEVMHDYDLLGNKDISQIVIIRDPKKSIPSSEILRRHNAPYDKLNILFETQNWIEWHNKVLENSDHLILILFEQLVDKPEDTLAAIADSLGIDHSDRNALGIHHGIYKKMADESNNIHVTSAYTDNYNEVVGQYMSQNEDLLNYVDELYEKLCTLAIEIQNKIGIN